LNSTIYVAPTEYIATSIAPFAFSFDEAIDTFGNQWHELSSSFQTAYVDMLTDFSLEFLDESGLLSSEVVSADIIVAWSNFFDNHITADLVVAFASGKNARLGFRVFETQFTLEVLTLDF